MGTNTMVAAIGLVIGPVLGGALVAISWHWVFWFNVPLALAGGALGARSSSASSPRRDTVRGLDVAGTLTFVVGLTGLVYGISRGGISGWDDPLVIGCLVVAAVLLPLFVLIEHRGAAPMLDLSIFRNRLFAAATGAAFINGLSRFALMFIFVFYFQGAQGDDPITAGIKLAPMAIGMLDRLAARRDLGRPPRLPHAGRRRDAGHRPRPRPDDDAAGRLAPTGRACSGSAGRDRLGDVQLAEHGGDDGHRAGRAPRDRRRRADDAAEHRRRDLDRLRARDRHRLRSRKEVLFAIFSGLASGLSSAQLDPFIHNMHRRSGSSPRPR